MPFGVLPGSGLKRRMGTYAKGNKPRRNKKMRKASSTVKLIKKVLADEIETKYVTQTLVNCQPFNSEITNVDVLPITPQLQQMGSDVGSAWQRNGVRISPKSLTLKCHWSYTPVARSGAIIVHYFILNSKTIKSALALPTGVVMNNLLRAGQGQLAIPFDGSQRNAQYPVNTLEYNVLHRGSFLLQKNTGTVQDSTTAGNQPIVNSVCFRKEFKIPLPAKLTYDQDNQNPRTVLYPNGFAPFMVFGYCHQDNTVPDTVNQDVTLTATSHMWFDDA